MNSTIETQPVQQTPEQLARVLEIQLAAQRQKREKARGSRGLGLAVGVVFIIIAAATALLILEHMLGELRGSRGAEMLPDSQPQIVSGAR